MIKLITLLLVVVCGVQYAGAQVPQPEIKWIKGIGGNNITGVLKQVTPATDGGFILAIGTNATAGTGNVDSFCLLSGNRQVFVKYNSDATAIEWSKCLVMDGDTTISYIFPTADGGFVFGGICTAGGFYICKQNAVGNIVWSREYSKGSSLGLRCMIATDDGGYIMGGGSYYVDSNVLTHFGSWTYSDIFVIKVDSNGNKAWTRVLGGTDDDVVYQVSQGPHHGYYVIGQTYSNDIDCIGNHGIVDGFVARLDSVGNLLWHKDFGGSVGDGFSCAVPNGRGGMVIGGAARSNDGDVTHHFGSGSVFWIVNIDSNGTQLWDSCYGGGGYESPNSMCKAADGSLWLVGVSSAKGGTVDTDYGNENAWFLHIDSNGKFINAKVLGSHNDDRGMMVYPLSNGNVIGGGFFQAQDGAFANATFYGGVDGFLVEFTSEPDLVKQIKTITGIVNIYPNPVGDILTISAERNSRYNLEVNDVIGRIIYKSAFIGTANIVVSGWVKGVYILSLTDDDGGKIIERIVLQ